MSGASGEATNGRSAVEATNTKKKKFELNFFKYPVLIWEKLSFEWRFQKYNKRYREVTYLAIWSGHLNYKIALIRVIEKVRKVSIDDFCNSWSQFLKKGCIQSTLLSRIQESAHIP